MQTRASRSGNATEPVDLGSVMVATGFDVVRAGDELLAGRFEAAPLLVVRPQRVRRRELVERQRLLNLTEGPGPVVEHEPVR